MDPTTIKFDKDVLFDNSDQSSVIDFREEMFRKFARGMTSLLESKRPKRYSSNRGLLDSRKLYRYKMDENIFYKKTSTPSSDTTFVFLIDASGSMNGRVYSKRNSMSRLDTCGAICSAFAKANKAVLDNKIKTEIFTKSAGGEIFNSFVKGYVPILSRVFSNVKNDTDWDKLCHLRACAPLTKQNIPVGSYTPEFLLLPTVMAWAKKNLSTKNMVIINLTDGDVVHQFIPPESISAMADGCGRGSIPVTRACDEDTKALRIKYLRGVPNTTLYISGSYGQNEAHDSHLKSIYGTNAVNVSCESFETQFFKTLTHLLQDYA